MAKRPLEDPSDLRWLDGAGDVADEPLVGHASERPAIAAASSGEAARRLAEVEVRADRQVAVSRELSA